MLRYILQRITGAAFVLLAVISITFFLMHAIPGGPFTSEKSLPPAVQKNIEEHYHLNDPLWKQYTDYLKQLSHGDLGPSFKYAGRSVNTIIADSFPFSCELGLLSIAIALILGVPCGTIAAIRQNHWPDYAAMLLATIGMSVPSFVLAALLINVFAIWLGWFPATMWDGLSYMVLPSIALSAYPAASIARLTRSGMLEVLNQDYIRTARAKGLPEHTVIICHALKNALIPTITYLGPMAAAILTGSFIIENIFAIPGLGQHFVTSIYNRDYTTILGITIFYSTLVIILNLLVDLIYPLLDPRIKLTDRQED